MKRHLLGLVGAAVGVGLWVACAEDPTGAIRNGIARVAPSATFTEVIVGDSASLSVRAEDEQGNPLPILPSVTSDDPSIATVAVIGATSGKPVPQTNFRVKGVGFGTTTLTMTAGGQSSQMTVRTLPKSIEVTSAVAIIGSGGSVTVSATALSSTGAAVAGVPLTFSSSDASVLEVDPVTGEVTAKAPGDAIITVVGPASETGGIVQAEGEISLSVIPDAFAGTVTPGAGTIDQIITITRDPGEPEFDADTEVSFDGASAAIVTQTADELEVAVPELPAGTVTLIVANIGPDQIALETTFDVTDPTAFDGTISAASAAFADLITITPGSIAWDGDEEVTIAGNVPYIMSQDATMIELMVPNAAAVGAADVLIRKQGADDIAGVESIDITSVFTPNPDPDVSPDITAGPFPLEFWISLSDASPDDFAGRFMPGADLDLTITLDWQGPSGDLDILTTDCPVTAFVGNLDGATAAIPEVTQETVPAGECWQLWLNKFDTGTGETMARVTVTSP